MVLIVIFFIKFEEELKFKSLVNSEMVSKNLTRFTCILF